MARSKSDGKVTAVGGSSSGRKYGSYRYGVNGKEKRSSLGRIRRFL
jgi:hypothetical protein